MLPPDLERPAPKLPARFEVAGWRPLNCVKPQPSLARWDGRFREKSDKE
jgi:hypothetical protein